MDKLSMYVSAAMAVLVAVSVVVHALGLDEKPWAKVLLSLSNDLVGAGKGLLGAKVAAAPETTPADPEAK